MAENEGFKRRYFAAVLEFARIEGKMPTQAEIGKRIAKELGGRKKRKAFSPSSVGRWKDGIMPDCETISAMARVFRVDPGWLAFGEESAAPAPPSAADAATFVPRELRKAEEG